MSSCWTVQLCPSPVDCKFSWWQVQLLCNPSCFQDQLFSKPIVFKSSFCLVQLFPNHDCDNYRNFSTKFIPVQVFSSPHVFKSSCFWSHLFPSPVADNSCWSTNCFCFQSICHPVQLVLTHFCLVQLFTSPVDLKCSCFQSPVVSESSGFWVQLFLSPKFPSAAFDKCGWSKNKFLHVPNVSTSSCLEVQMLLSPVADGSHCSPTCLKFGTVHVKWRHFWFHLLTSPINPNPISAFSSCFQVQWFSGAVVFTTIQSQVLLIMCPIAKLPSCFQIHLLCVLPIFSTPSHSPTKFLSSPLVFISRHFQVQFLSSSVAEKSSCFPTQFLSSPNGFWLWMLMSPIVLISSSEVSQCSWFWSQLLPK